MIQIAPQIRILVAIEPIDGRKGIDALAQLCREKLLADPFSGYEPDTHAAESTCVGRKRAMGMCETIGARTLSLARGNRRAKRVDATGRNLSGA